MNIYHYDNNGFYTQTTTARQSPLEPGVFLVPARATTLQPPALLPNTVVVFNGSSWNQLADNRGRYYDHNREEVWLHDVGVPVPEGWTVEPRQLTDEELGSQQRAAIAEQRYATETGGVMFGEYQILTDRESQQILDSAIEKIRRGLVPSISWKCGNGKWLTLDADNIVAVEVAVLSHVQGSFAWEKAELERLGLLEE